MEEINLENWFWPARCPFCGVAEATHASGGEGCAHLLYVVDGLSNEVCYRSTRLKDRELDSFPNVVKFSSTLIGFTSHTFFAPLESEMGSEIEADCPSINTPLLPDASLE